jgi:hypothetical protein
MHTVCRNSWHRECALSMAQNEQDDKGWSPCPLCRQPLNSKSRVDDFLNWIISLPIAIRPGHQQRLQKLSISWVAVSIMILLTLVMPTWVAVRSFDDGPQVLRGALSFMPTLISTGASFASGALAFETYRATVVSTQRMPNLLPMSTEIICSLAILRTGYLFANFQEQWWLTLHAQSLHQGLHQLPGSPAMTLWDCFGTFMKKMSFFIVGGTHGLTVSLEVGSVRKVWRA